MSLSGFTFGDALAHLIPPLLIWSGIGTKEMRKNHPQTCMPSLLEVWMKLMKRMKLLKFWTCRVAGSTDLKRILNDILIKISSNMYKYIYIYNNIHMALYMLFINTHSTNLKNVLFRFLALLVCWLVYDMSWDCPILAFYLCCHHP